MPPFARQRIIGMKEAATASNIFAAAPAVESAVNTRREQGRFLGGLSPYFLSSA